MQPDQERPFGRKAPTPPPERPTIASLVDAVVEEGRNMVTSQINLLKKQTQATAKRGGGAAAAFAVAALFALALFWWTFHTLELLLTGPLPAWGASLIVWGIQLVVVIVAVLVGKVLLDKAKRDAPDPKQMVQEDVSALKEGLGK